MEVAEEELAEFFSVVSPLLDERQRRVMVGAAAPNKFQGAWNYTVHPKAFK